MRLAPVEQLAQIYFWGSAEVPPYIFLKSNSRELCQLLPSPIYCLFFFSFIFISLLFITNKSVNNLFHVLLANLMSDVLSFTKF